MATSTNLNYGFNFNPTGNYIINPQANAGFGITANDIAANNAAQQITSFGQNTPTVSQGNGFFNSIGNAVGGFVDRAGSVLGSIPDRVSTWYNNNFAYPNLQQRPYSILNGPNSFNVTNPAENISLIGNMNNQASTVTPTSNVPLNDTSWLAYNTGVNPAENKNLFGWSNDTWNNINTALQIGQFGWNAYSNWKQMQMAEAALAEQQAMNAYNRSLSTFNTNTQIEQANQSLRDRLYARQKYETGSTEGAEQLYKERELQKFRG